MERLNLDNKNLRKFGITMGIAFLVITFLILIKHRHSILPVSIISALFFILAFTLPEILKPVYIFWMKLAFILSWINTRLLLIIIFYLVFIPISLGMKLFAADPLNRKLEKDKISYWKKKEKEAVDVSSYERQF